MSIEEALQLNTAAIKSLTSAMSNQGSAKPSTGKAAEKKPATGTTKAPAASVKAVSDLVLSMVELEQRAVVVRLLKEQGATKVKDIPKAKLPILQKKLAAALKRVKAEKATAESDEADSDFDEEIQDGEEPDAEIDADDDLSFLDE